VNFSEFHSPDDWEKSGRPRKIRESAMALRAVGDEYRARHREADAQCPQCHHRVSFLPKAPWKRSGIRYNITEKKQREMLVKQHGGEKASCGTYHMTKTT
jgi:hypothetical protein